jgi:outer membrane lipase/esterase
MLCLVLAWFVPPLRAGQFREMVVFGDSTLETGNVFAHSGNTFPDPNSYYQGRWSNGPVWVERLASNLGVPVPTASLLGGTNYGWGGAGTGLGSYNGVPNAASQIIDYLGSHEKLDAGQLFVVEGGYNDFGHTDPSISVTNLAYEIAMLAEDGGKYFLVPNLIAGIDAPWYPYGDPETVLETKLFGIQFNKLVPAELTELETTLGIKIFRFDLESLTREIVHDPAAFSFTNLTDPAKSGDIGGPGTAVSNPDQYMFWDWAHPTTAWHQIMGDRALGAMFSFTVAAPSSVTPGTAFDLTVKTLDPFGDIDANYQGTVTFSTSDTDKGAVLPADYTFTEADAGVHTFPGAVTLMTPGEQTVRTTQKATGITGVVTITVGSGQ